MTEAIRLTAHDYLVGVLARWLERNDYRVAVALEERTKPPLINGYRPDVFATQGGGQIIGEAEVCESLDDAKQRATDWGIIRAGLLTSSVPAVIVSSPPKPRRRTVLLMVKLSASSFRGRGSKHVKSPGILRATFHSEQLAIQPTQA